jgi:hypothetical protein
MWQTYIEYVLLDMGKQQENMLAYRPALRIHHAFHENIVPSQPTNTVDENYYDIKTNTLSWIYRVFTVGSPAVWSDAITLNSEEVRELVSGNWREWGVLWLKPRRPSRFSSNDRAMHLYMCNLPREGAVWEEHNQSGGELSDSDFDV